MAEGCMLEPLEGLALGLRKDFAAAAAAAAAAEGFRGEGGTLLLPRCATSEGTDGVVDGGRPP